eukprot:GEZU01016325.1.p1 GENE.GEZU01016325.1~~GEZU01016325.1.p1  ORF type:complete len:104 (+),score=16.57 GEZU01016325.1:102-413(+)
MNAEDWLKQFKEVSEDLIQAKADLHERNQLIRNGADFSKLNSKIRRQLNRIEREMRDLNDSLEHMIRRPKNFSLLVFTNQPHGMQTTTTSTTYPIESLIRSFS